MLLCQYQRYAALSKSVKCGVSGALVELACLFILYRRWESPMGQLDS